MKVAYRLEWNIVDGEDMKVGHVVHHIVEGVAPPVLYLHTLEFKNKS